MDIVAVEGIIGMKALTVVPRAPSNAEGVTNLRGAICVSRLPPHETSVMETLFPTGGAKR